MTIESEKPIEDIDASIKPQEAIPDNIPGKKEIQQETKIQISWLKPKDKWLDVDNGKVEFEWLFKDTQSDIIKWSNEIISKLVENSKILNQLSSDKKDKIKIWLTSRLINSWIVDKLIQWFWSKIDWYDKLVNSKNPADIISGAFENDKKEATKKDGLPNLIETVFKGDIEMLEKFVEKNRTNPNFDKFFSNSINIENLKDNTDINSFTFAEVKDEKTAFEAIRSKILSFDKTLLKAEITKEHIFDSVATLPNFISGAIINFMIWLCKIDFIWDFIKKFLWIKEGTDVEKELRWQLDARKSINALKGFWLQRWKDGQISESQNNPAISILKNKDLNNLDVKKIKDPLVKIGVKWANIASNDFWYNLFEKNTIEFSTKWENSKEIKSSATIPANMKIDDKDFDNTKTPNEGFYKKLNNILNIWSDLAKPKEEIKPYTVADIPKQSDTQYKDLLIWVVIGNEYVSKLKSLTLADFINSNEEEFKNKVKALIGDNEKALVVILQYRTIIQDLKQKWKLEEFQKICIEDKRDKDSKEITFLDISHKRYFLIKELTWYIPEFHDWTAPIVTTQNPTKPQDKQEKKPEVVQDNILPKQVEFNKNDKTILVDWRKYGISVFHNTFNKPVELKDIQYNQTDGTLNLTWWIDIPFPLSSISDTKQLKKVAVEELYSKIKPLKAGWPSFENNYDWVKVTVSALA